MSTLQGGSSSKSHHPVKLNFKHCVLVSAHLQAVFKITSSKDAFLQYLLTKY